MEKEEGKNKYSKDFKVPPNFDEVLRGLTREILRNQPEDISKFGNPIFFVFVRSTFYSVLTKDMIFTPYTAYEYFANELQARALASD